MVATTVILFFFKNSTTSKALPVATATEVDGNTEEQGQILVFPYQDGTLEWLDSEQIFANQLIKNIIPETEKIRHAKNLIKGEPVFLITKSSARYSAKLEYKSHIAAEYITCYPAGLDEQPFPTRILPPGQGRNGPPHVVVATFSVARILSAGARMPCAM